MEAKKSTSKKSEAPAVRLVGKREQFHVRPAPTTISRRPISSRNSEELERERIALTVLRERQSSENAEQANRLRARKQALHVEKKRAQLVSSLPPPAREHKPAPEKEKLIDVYDFESMGIGRIPLKPGAVRKCSSLAQGDARVAAAEYRPEVPFRTDETKVKSRFHKAVAKEKIVQEYDTVMKDVERHQRKTSKMAAAPVRKKCLKVDKPASAKSVYFEENAMEKAVEDLFRDTSDLNVTVRKKRPAKKQARLSVGKTCAIVTPKGTLTIKQSGLSKFLLQIRKEKSKYTGSVIEHSLANTSKETGDLETSKKQSTPVKQLQPRLSPVSPTWSNVVSEETRKPAVSADFSCQASLSSVPDLPSSSATSYFSLPSGFGVSPTVAKVLDISSCKQATQTSGDLVLAYQKMLLDRVKKASPSANLAPVSPTCIDSSSSYATMSSGSQSTLSPTAAMSPNLCRYIRQLAKKHFPKERSSSVDSQTESWNGLGINSSNLVLCKPTKYFPEVNLEQIKKVDNTNLSNKEPPRIVITSPPAQKMPYRGTAVKKDAVPTGNKATVSKNQSPIVRKSSPGPSRYGVPTTSTSNIAPEKTVSTKAQQSTAVLTDKILLSPYGLLLPLAPPMTLTLKSPESTLVVQIKSPELESSNQPSNESIKVKVNSRCSSPRIGSSSKSNVSTESKPSAVSVASCSSNLGNSPVGDWWKQSSKFSVSCGKSFEGRENSADDEVEHPGLDPESLQMSLLHLDKCFRPHPPASLPLGWRQIQTPHELSTICEMDTPDQSSLQEASPPNRVVDIEPKNPASSTSDASFMTLTPVSKQTMDSGDKASVPLWEQIFAEICNSTNFSTRWDVEKDFVPQTATPFQSTPVKGDVGFNLEFESGIQEQSFISLVGSEVTTCEEERRKVNENYAASTTGETAWFTLTPQVPQMDSSPALQQILAAASQYYQSPKAAYSESILSFLRHELSCAALSPANGSN